MEANRKLLIDKEEMDKIFGELASAIIDKNHCTNKLMLIGIQTRGIPMLDRIAKLIEERCEHRIAKGQFEIKLYQEDLRPIGKQPVAGKTLLQGSVDGKNVILLDDVLFTGRTTRVAINKVVEMGNPESIQLCVFVDRGWHKYPICADFVGRKIETAADEEIQVRFEETDGEDAVYLKKIE